MDDSIKSAKALKSGIWYTISNFILKGINFITTPIFARMLSLDDYGKYSNYLSWYQILTIIVPLNLVSTTVCAKYDYENKFDNYIANMMEFTAALSAISMVIVNIFPTFFVSLTNIEIHNFNILLLSILFTSCLNIFQSREKLLYSYKTSTFLSMATAIFNVLISLLLVYIMEDDYSARVIGGSSSTIFIGLFVTGYFICRYGKFNWEMWKYAIPITLPYIPHSLSLMVLNSMDRIQITNYCGSVETALYSLAYSVAAVVTLLLVCLNEAYVPWFADKLNNEEYASLRKTNKIYQLVFSLGAVGIMLIAPEVLTVLGGEKYVAALDVIPPVILGCVFQFFYTMYVNTEQIKKNTFKMALGSISAATLNYILNSIFIPRYGYIAAAYTTVASYFWLYGVHVFIVKKMGFSHVYNKGFEISILLLLIAVDFFISKLYGYKRIRLITIVIYCFIILLVMFVKRKEISGIIKLIRRER